MTRFPKPSTCALQPGGSTVAEVYSVIIAGPWIESPGSESVAPVKARRHESAAEVYWPLRIAGGAAIARHGLRCAGAYGSPAAIMRRRRFTISTGSPDIAESVALLVQPMKGRDGSCAGDCLSQGDIQLVSLAAIAHVHACAAPHPAGPRRQTRRRRAAPAPRRCRSRFSIASPGSITVRE